MGRLDGERIYDASGRQVGRAYIHVGYNASKGAVRLITKAAAAQHGKDGIRVNSVHPGLMPPMRTSGRTADPRTTVPPWKVLDSKYSYRDRWLTLRSDTVELPNGRVLAPFHVIEQPDWSTAIALTHDGNVVLVEEYRHGAAQTVVELPSGIIEGPGTPIEHMKRELLEETGFASDEWHPLGSFFANAP
eukprot:gene8642-11000_t